MLLPFTCFHVSLSKGMGTEVGERRVLPPAPKIGMHGCLTAILRDMPALTLSKQMQSHWKTRTCTTGWRPEDPRHGAGVWQEPTGPLLSFVTGEMSGRGDGQSPSWCRHKRLCPLVTSVLTSAGLGTRWVLNTCLHARLGQHQHPAWLSSGFPLLGWYSRKSEGHMNLWASAEMFAVAQYLKMVAYKYLGEYVWGREGDKKNDAYRMTHLGPRHTKEQQY